MNLLKDPELRAGILSERFSRRLSAITSIFYAVMVMDLSIGCNRRRHLDMGCDDRLGAVRAPHGECVDENRAPGRRPYDQRYFFLSNLIL
jgi:hypothetical protein